MSYRIGLDVIKIELMTQSELVNLAISIKTIEIILTFLISRACFIQFQPRWKFWMDMTVVFITLHAHKVPDNFISKFKERN